MTDTDINFLLIAVLCVLAIIQTFRLSYLAGRLDHHRETIVRMSVAMEAHHRLIMMLRADQNAMVRKAPLGEVLGLWDYEKEGADHVVD